MSQKSYQSKGLINFSTLYWVKEVCGDLVYDEDNWKGILEKVSTSWPASVWGYTKAQKEIRHFPSYEKNHLPGERTELFETGSQFTSKRHSDPLKQAIPPKTQKEPRDEYWNDSHCTISGSLSPKICKGNVHESINCIYHSSIDYASLFNGYSIF